MIKRDIAFSSFSAPDLDAERRFYRDTLGLDVVDGSMGTLELRMGSAKVLIYPKAEHEPASFTVLNFPVEDVEAEVDRLSALGVRFEHYDGERSRPMRKGSSAATGRRSRGSRIPQATSCRCWRRSRRRRIAPGCQGSSRPGRRYRPCRTRRRRIWPRRPGGHSKPERRDFSRPPSCGRRFRQRRQAPRAKADGGSEANLIASVPNFLFFVSLDGADFRDSALLKGIPTCVRRL